MGKVKLAFHKQLHEICAVKIIPRAAKLYQRAHAADPPPALPQEAMQRQKEFEKEMARDKRTIREGALGRLLFHPFICRLYEMVPMTNHYYMLFEYVEGGQMLDYIVAHGLLKEKHARKFARGIALALEYCHRNNVVHRDLKIENIMINAKGDIKIIDFGLLNLYLPQLLLKTYCGSLYFAAPELLSAKPYTGPEVDVWLFGVVLYVLLCGKVPFDDQLVLVLHEKIKKGHVEYPAFLLRECVLLLLRMLVVDPAKRASLDEVMNHPWMNKGYEHKVLLYLPKRTPLRLPLDPDIVKTIALFDLGLVALITDELTAVLTLVEYQMSCENWQKLADQGRDYALALNAHLLPDPTGGFHPLILIYFLVDEMKKRKKAKEDAIRAQKEKAAVEEKAAAEAKPTITTLPPEAVEAEAASRAGAVGSVAAAAGSVPGPATGVPGSVPGAIPGSVPGPIPTGPTGSTGPTGPTGPTGSIPTGPTGPTGPIPTGPGPIPGPIPANRDPIPTREPVVANTANPAHLAATPPLSGPVRLQTLTRKPPVGLPELVATPTMVHTPRAHPLPSARSPASPDDVRSQRTAHRHTAIVGNSPEPGEDPGKNDINVITLPGPDTPSKRTTVRLGQILGSRLLPLLGLDDVFRALDANPEIAPLLFPEPVHNPGDYGPDYDYGAAPQLALPMAEPVPRFNDPVPRFNDPVPSEEPLLPARGGINNLLRRLSSKRRPTLPTADGSPRKDPLVRRGVLMKVTAKEKINPPADKWRQGPRKLGHHRSHLLKGAHGFVPVEYLPPLPNILTLSHGLGSSAANLASPSYVATPGYDNSLQVPGVAPLTLLRRKFHPTARAKSVGGHIRKDLYGLRVPREGLAGQNSDDNFLPTDAFDDINLDDVNDLPEYPHEVPALLDDQIMDEYRHARPGAMPLIDHCKTMFLKGFFSVQTTLTKPLPVIRYNIIRVLLLLGVRFQEVRGGFVCLHTPSYHEEPAEYTDEERRLYGDAFKLTLLLMEAATPEQPLRQPLLLTPDDATLDHTPGHRALALVLLAGPGSMGGSTAYSHPPSAHGTPSAGTSYLGLILVGGHRRKTLYQKRNGDNTQMPPLTPAAAKAMRGFADDVDLTDDSDAFRAHLAPVPVIDDSIDLINGLAVQGGSDMLISSRIEQRARHQHLSLVLSTLKQPVRRTPVNFQIEIVKVPILNLHALILKKIVGNTWNYKHLADRIIGDLNL